MQRTKIEYLSHTWNPLAMRCTPVSAGCDHCWHLRMANRLGGNGTLPERDRNGYNLGIPWLKTKELAAPLKLKKPAIIGVQFMGDLFHESVTNEQIAAVFGVLAACPQHTFCVLTKRPERMVRFFMWLDDDGPEWTHNESWPLPNVMLGVSVEDQKTYDERWPHVERTPAAVRYVSYEPALGGLDLSRSFGLYQVEWPDGKTSWATKVMSRWEGAPDFVICGSETGPGKRPMDLNWARDLRDQCAAASVPFFFKVDSFGNHEIDGRTWEEMP